MYPYCTLVAHLKTVALATGVRVGTVRNMKNADDFMWFFRDEELSLEEKE